MTGKKHASRENTEVISPAATEQVSQADSRTVRRLTVQERVKRGKAGSFFQSMGTGGSLSRTGVSVRAGANSRLGGVFARLWLGFIVLLFGSQAEKVFPATAHIGCREYGLGSGAELVEGAVVSRGRSMLRSIVHVTVPYPCRGNEALAGERSLKC